MCENGSQSCVCVCVCMCVVCVCVACMFVCVCALLMKWLYLCNILCLLCCRAEQSAYFRLCTELWVGSYSSMHHTINDNPPSKTFCLMSYTFPTSASFPSLRDIGPLHRSAQGVPPEQSPVVFPPQVLEEEVHQTQKKGAVPGKDSRQ